MLLLFGTASALAQAQDVAGTVVTEADGEPLPGVNVVVKGSTVGATTDADGAYTLSVPSPQQDTLAFSFVGYETQEIPVEGRSAIDVALASETITGEELVVVGYSTQRRADVTGAVDVANVENMKKLSSAQVTEQMQGQVSGVSIQGSGQPGDEPQINIRGFNTFGNNQPLFVVDGVPTQDISYLNPRDIESLQVLKDAGSTSQYGARASNGVVVVTTSQGRGDISVNYDASVGYQVPESGNVWNALSPQEQGQLEWMAQQNTIDRSDDPDRSPSHPIWGDGADPDVPEFLLPERAENPNFDNYFVNPEYTDAGELSEFFQIVRANQDGTNWFDEISDPALTTQHNLSVGGGGDLGNYYTSFSYTNQQGTLMNTSLERFTIRANTEFNARDNIRIGENLTFALSENYQSGTLSEGTAIGMSYRIQSIIPTRDVMGNFAGTAPDGLGNADNPLAYRERAAQDDDEDRRLFGNVFAEIDFLGDFTARSSLGADINSGYFTFFTFPEYESSENSTVNAYNEQTYNNRSWTWTNTVNYQSTFAESHNVTALGGIEAVHNTSRFDQVGRQDYFSFNPDYTQLETGAGTPTISSSSRIVNSLLSFFGTVDYNYKNTYLLGLTVRRDGSSRFLENQWGTFPSVTAGWRASELPALKSVPWLTDLKVRGSYGVVGNQLNVNVNNAYTLYGGTVDNAYYPIGGGNTETQQGFRQVRIGNPDAKWERNVDANIGLDLAVFNGQLEVTADLYRKDVLDLLYAPPLPATAGAAAAPERNVAEMRNQGLDLSLRGQTNISDLNLDAQLTLTTFDNEIIAVAEDLEQFSLDQRRFGTEIIRNEAGQPISSFYGYDITGFWQTEEEIEEANAGAEDGEYMQDAAVGRFRYRDVNGDGEITTDDRTFLGSPHASFSYGLNLNLAYRSWDLTAFIYGEQGKEIWNQVRWWTDFYGTFAGAKSETALYDSWTPENTDATAPIQEAGQFFSTSAVPNSYYVEDGSFLRMRNLQLGYTLPPSLTQQVGAQTLRVYLQAENLFTITGYSGLDPEVGVTQSADNAGGAGTTNFGIDGGTYPTPRAFTFGVNLSF